MPNRVNSQMFMFMLMDVFIKGSHMQTNDLNKMECNDNKGSHACCHLAKLLQSVSFYEKINKGEGKFDQYKTVWHRPTQYIPSEFFRHGVLSRSWVDSIHSSFAPFRSIPRFVRHILDHGSLHLTYNIPTIMSSSICLSLS